MQRIKDDRDDQEIIDIWEEIRTLIESMDLDLRKNAIRSNIIAGIRARRGLRLLKRLAHNLLMTSMNIDKKRKVRKHGD